jgi:predicted DNA-binding transcriptional regulator AlpA
VLAKIGTLPRAAKPAEPPVRLDLVGVAEAAALLGISRSSLWERRGRKDLLGRIPEFPKPVAELACGPIWQRSQIREYKRARERARRQYPWLRL